MITVSHYHPNTGQLVTSEVETAEKVEQANIEMGRLGYTPVLVQPAGGFRFGYKAEERFNWASIGAYKMINSEGEEIVIWRGETYKKRILEAVNSKKMTLPEAIKYSRGAKAGDPEHMREKADGDFEYVTLAMFRGNSRVNEATQLSDAEFQKQTDRLKREKDKIK